MSPQNLPNYGFSTPQEAHQFRKWETQHYDAALSHLEKVSIERVIRAAEEEICWAFRETDTPKTFEWENLRDEMRKKQKNPEGYYPALAEGRHCFRKAVANSLVQEVFRKQKDRVVKDPTTRTLGTFLEQCDALATNYDYMERRALQLRARVMREYSDIPPIYTTNVGAIVKEARTILHALGDQYAKHVQEAQVPSSS